MANDFAKWFEELTGHAPFPWQEHLYEKWFLRGRFPSTCDLPTGVGKTSVIAVWLIALANGANVPRRLVYVVNRRTVVDQTTNEVERLRRNLKNAGLAEALCGMCAFPLDDDEPPLAISTLRGQFADNEQWAIDPARPAVICGTVDMIGSRLLFGGYRIGFRKRPLHAAFLGQDALLVHDEAHLEPAFQTLISDIEKEQEHERARAGDLPWPKLRVMELSATARGDCANGDGTILKLGNNDHSHHIIQQRITARKTLRLHPCEDEKKKLAADIVERATTSEHLESGDAILVFVRLVQDAVDVADALRKALQKAKLPEHVASLTGTMRGLERDGLVRDPVFARFMPKSDRPADVTPAEGTIYLVATSAGEVGVNLSADHMVCDLSTLDSMIQRLGRVNRFGNRDDTCIDIVHPPSDAFDEEHPLTAARKATLKLLEELNGDASPKALDALRQRSDLPCKLADAFAPKPTILRASDILFDAWAMTTIREKMPGRPPVGPYLHGQADDLPQTTVAWRAELDLIDPELPDPASVLQRIFTKHRIRPHETITTNSFRVAEFLNGLKKRTDLHETRVALLSPNELRLTSVGELIDDSGALNAEPTLILPASFGGLDGQGMLSADAVPEKESGDASEGSDSGDEPSSEEAAASGPALDVADQEGYEPFEGASPRIRVLIDRSDEGWRARPMPGGKPLPADWHLNKRYDTSTKLVNAIRQESKLNVRLVETIKQNDEGEAVCSLVCLSPAPAGKTTQQEQKLAEHVRAVEQAAKDIAENLELQEPYRSALLFAAEWHDEGKKAPLWQRYIGGPNSHGEPLGKSEKWRDPKLLAGYRHEFGSLMCLAFPAEWSAQGTPPADEATRDLALHMIAAHHGYARPHFTHTVVDGFNSEQENSVLVEVMRRYARLQRKYGRWGLAYLESLLRAADAAASRTVGIDPEADDDPEAADMEGPNA